MNDETIHAGCCARPTTLTMCGQPGRTDHNSLALKENCPACEAFYMDEETEPKCPNGFDCATDGIPVQIVVSIPQKN